MKFLSLFSGIEAASEAWAPLGWECVGVSEIEPTPCLVLKHRHPNVPNLGDVTKITEDQIADLGQIDVLVFGSPCQDLSIAGKQRGFQDGTRSSLFFPAVRIIEWARVWCGLRWAVWENVPGAFSSNAGRDFAEVVKHLAGLPDIEVPKKGWGTEGAAVGSEALVEWAVLDAQWFGVAQRRRRVFAIADFGDWSGRPPILLERDGMRGDSAPRREAGEGTAGTLTARPEGGGFPGTDEALSGYVQAFGGNNTSGPIDVSTALKACGTSSGRLDFESETFIAFDTTHMTAHQVRRLTVRECERLQGFPDDHTLVPVAEYTTKRVTKNRPERRWRKRPDGIWELLTADSARYKALGNSMAVPVMAWIGKQIDFVHTFFDQQS